MGRSRSFFHVLAMFKVGFHSDEHQEVVGQQPTVISKRGENLQESTMVLKGLNGKRHDSRNSTHFTMEMLVHYSQPQASESFVNPEVHGPLDRKQVLCDSILTLRGSGE